MHREAVVKSSVNPRKKPKKPLTEGLRGRKNVYHWTDARKRYLIALIEEDNTRTNDELARLMNEKFPNGIRSDLKEIEKGFEKLREMAAFDNNRFDRIFYPTKKERKEFQRLKRLITESDGPVLIGKIYDYEQYKIYLRKNGNGKLDPKQERILHAIVMFTYAKHNHGIKYAIRLAGVFKDRWGARKAFDEVEQTLIGLLRVFATKCFNKTLLDLMDKPEIIDATITYPLEKSPFVKFEPKTKCEMPRQIQDSGHYFG